MLHLDAKYVRASLHELVSQLQVVIQRVFLPHGVRDVACVRDGRFHHTSRCSSRLHSQQQVGKVVQRVKDTEDVHAVLFSHLAKSGTQVITLRTIPVTRVAFFQRPSQFSILMSAPFNHILWVLSQLLPSRNQSKLILLIRLQGDLVSFPRLHN